MIQEFDVRSFEKGFATLKAAEDWAVDNLGEGWHVVCNKTKLPQDFNQKASGKYIYIFFRTDVKVEGAVAAIRITASNGTSEEWITCPQNLNEGTSSKKALYLSYCNLKCATDPVVGGVQSGYGASVESAMKDFSPGHVVLRQDVNQGAGGKYIFLGYTYGR